MQRWSLEGGEKGVGYQNAVTRECLHLRNSPQEKQGVVFVQSVSYVFRGKWILLS